MTDTRDLAAALISAQKQAAWAVLLMRDRKTTQWETYARRVDVMVRELEQLAGLARQPETKS